jgi:hypothetical protein
MLIFTLSFLSFAEIFFFFPLAFVYFASNTKYEFVFKNSTSRRLETNKKGVKTSAACENKSEKNKVKRRDETRKEIFVCMCISQVDIFVLGGEYFFLNKK